MYKFLRKSVLLFVLTISLISYSPVLIVEAAIINPPTNYNSFSGTYTLTGITQDFTVPGDGTSVAYRINLSNYNVICKNAYESIMRLSNMDQQDLYEGAIFFRDIATIYTGYSYKRQPGDKWSNKVNSSPTAVYDQFSFSFFSTPVKQSKITNQIGYTYPTNGINNFGQDSLTLSNIIARGNQRYKHIRIHFNLQLKWTVYSPKTISDISGQISDIQDSIDNGVTSIINNNNDNTKKTTDVIKQQTQNINDTINNGVTTIVNNNNSNTTKITDGIKQQTQDITQNANQNTQKVLDQNSQFRQEDIDKSNELGSVATNFINNAETTIKSKWEILFYPIEFTQNLLTVFTGGTKSRTYANKYNGVEGFVYLEDTGGLTPVINLQQARFGPKSAGTNITFPSFVLPVLNVKLWDSYSFDLATIKSSFPVLFNAIYVVTGVLELYWFVGFLSDKYREVFN